MIDFSSNPPELYLIVLSGVHEFWKRIFLIELLEILMTIVTIIEAARTIFISRIFFGLVMVCLIAFERKKEPRVSNHSIEQDLDSLGLSAFLAVCATKTFTRAASLLHITQSALSQRIKRFEENLNTELIDRNFPVLTLTRTGQEVLSYGIKKRILVENLHSKLKAIEHQAFAQEFLRIGAFSSVLRSKIMPALSSLFRKHENITVEYFSREVFELSDMLLRGVIDVAVLNYDLADESITRVHLFDEHLVMIESDKFWATTTTYLDHDPLDQTTFNFLHHNGLPYQNLRRRYCDDIYGVIDGVRQGIGIAVAPRHLIQDERGVKVRSDYKELMSPVIAHFSNEINNDVLSSINHALKAAFLSSS